MTHQLGQVFYIQNCRHAKPHPKNKYVVVVCITSHCLGFFINSRVNPFIRNHPHLSSCEVLIETKHHSFLHHDSYIDCREAFIFAEYELGDRQGTVSEAAKKAVYNAVSSCSVLPRRLKKMILESLADSL